MSASRQRMVSNDLVKSYFSEIGRYPLLEPHEEVSLSQKVQSMMPLIKIREDLQQGLGHVPNEADWALQADLTPDALRRIVAQGKRAKQRMIESNLRLVVSIAKKYTDRNVELLDLIQEGSIGLERAVDKFDPEKGYRFSTYAYWWIRQAITRAIATQARTIRLPIHVGEKLNKIKKAQRELSQQLGKTPSLRDIASYLSLPVEEIRYSVQIACRPTSLDISIGDDTGSPLKDLIEAQGENPEDLVDRQILAQSLRNLLETLTPQQRLVIELRFGLTDSDPCTLAEVGRHMGISRERVRQIQRDALIRLRLNKKILE